MTTASISLQDLRRKIYVKAKADQSWRFWGLYVHVCRWETLTEAYKLAKQNKGAPGVDGVSFDDIEHAGVQQFLDEIQRELVDGTYRPLPNRRVEIPKGKGKTRMLGIPCIRDRVVQGALKLILEPIFESDFQSGSFGYRPKKTAHEAINRVADSIVRERVQVIDIDLKAYFDTVRHDILLAKVAQRVDDRKIMRLLKLILKTSGKQGVPQGGLISPLLSNLYLNEVDKMLEKAKEVTRTGKYIHLEYARFADDLVVLVDGFKKWRWLTRAVMTRLCQEFQKLGVELNTEKTKVVDLSAGGVFSFLGFHFRRAITRNGKVGVLFMPTMKARKSLTRKLKVIFRRFQSQPISRVISIINPILRGWVNYFRVGMSSRCFGYIKDWVEKKVRRHLMKARGYRGFGWDRWSRSWLYKELGLFRDYYVQYMPLESAANR
ncbi:MAG: group II intron reverse transcriptase/maturase [Thiotrichales bacterium SG8_50]|nr:MAG: group II intron reverse transcriptase/maturase [Thiotrichales bacterium SG8_50]